MNALAAGSATGRVLARILSEQRLGRPDMRLHVAEGVAVAKAGGPLMTLGRLPGYEGSRRAAKSFGLVGGELCGCRAPGCAPCTSDGCAPRVSGCKDANCATCASVSGATIEKRVAREKEVTEEVEVAHLGFLPWDPGPGIGLDTESYVDVHSHLFASNTSDWGWTQFWDAFGAVPSTSTVERIERLYSLEAYGVTRMAISGMYDDTSREYLFYIEGFGGFILYDGVDGTDLDDMVLYAASLYPDYFVPFVRGFAQELDLASPWTQIYVRAAVVSGGFQGVGELIIHGHGADYTDTDALEATCESAFYGDTPILLHWEFIGCAAEDTNYTQLLDLIGRFADVPSGDAVFIIAHCGLGPDPVDLTKYEARLDELLAYERVYFDFSGMQVGATQKLMYWDGAAWQLTLVGELILEKMATSSDRFMFGIDAETRTDTRLFADYTASVAAYEAFLDKSSLTWIQKGRIKHTNASSLF